MTQNWIQISNFSWTFFEFYLLIYIDNNENSNNVTSLRKLKYFFNGKPFIGASPSQLLVFKKTNVATLAWGKYCESKHRFQIGYVESLFLKFHINYCKIYILLCMPFFPLMKSHEKNSGSSYTEGNIDKPIHHRSIL